MIRVLHVDDEADIREIAEFALSLDSGLAIRSAADGQEALAIVAQWLPDLILLDVMMPGLDGPSTLARLRQSPATRDIPVVFMTARAQSRDIQTFATLDACGVIAKPFDPLTLARQVRGFLA